MWRPFAREFTDGGGFAKRGSTAENRPGLGSRPATRSCEEHCTLRALGLGTRWDFQRQALFDRGTGNRAELRQLPANAAQYRQAEIMISTRIASDPSCSHGQFRGPAASQATLGCSLHLAACGPPCMRPQTGCSSVSRSISIHSRGPRRPAAPRRHGSPHTQPWMYPTQQHMPSHVARSSRPDPLDIEPLSTEGDEGRPSRDPTLRLSGSVDSRSARCIGLG